jgi:hypothetical protein
MGINIYIHRYIYAPANNILTIGEHRGEHFLERGTG